VLAVAPTGSGKTLAYVLPLLQLLQARARSVHLRTHIRMHIHSSVFGAHDD
jgi:superfamily II DNA/RNA helicase